MLRKTDSTIASSQDAAEEETDSDEEEDSDDEEEIATEYRHELELIDALDEDKELKKQWVLAGEKLEDYTRANFRKKLKQQERADFALAFITGSQDYNAKIAKIEKIHKRRKRIKQVLLAPLGLPKAVGNEVKSLGINTAVALEPKYRKRARRRIEHLAKIEEHEATARQLVREGIKLRNTRDRHRRLEHQLDHERGKLLEHIKPSEDFKNELETQNKKKEREAELQAFRDRRKRNVEQLTKLAHDRKKEKETAENMYKVKVRQWRQQHYTRVAVQARDEAKARRAQAAEKRDLCDAQLAARLAAQTQDRDLAMAIEQTKGPVLTESVILPESNQALGVFGSGAPTIPFTQGEKSGPPESYTNISTSAADHPTIPLFSTATHGITSDHEQKWDTLNILESELMKSRDSAQAFGRELLSLTDTTKALEQQKQRLHAERSQLQAEHTLLLKRIAGPPRRPATEEEREATHRRTSRSSNLQHRIEKIEREVLRLQEEAQDTEKQQAKAQARAAALGERCHIARRKLLPHAPGDTTGELPIIVGKSLSNPETVKSLGISAIQAQPVQAYDALTEMTKLELAHTEAKQVLKARKETIRLEQKIWAKEQERINERAHFDTMLTRLADIAGRVKQSRVVDLRSDLVQALQLWWANGEQLKAVDVRHHGSINWWSTRIEHMCHDIEQWRSSDEFRFDGVEPRRRQQQVDSTGGTDAPREETIPMNLLQAERSIHPNIQGIAHGSATQGLLVGEMDLPKFDLYTIELVVTKRDPEATNLGDSNDQCTIRIGTSIRHLKTVSVIKNVIDEYSGTARFEVTHAMRTQRLAWRIEFISSSECSDTHFAIEQGAYTQKRIPPLEFVDGSNRVVSSYVKRVRVERKQGQTKHADWLSELIVAEGVASEKIMKEQKTSTKLTKQSARAPPGMWDSTAMHGTPQRYPINAFCSLLRSELQAAAKRDAEKSGLFLPNSTNQRLSSGLKSVLNIKEDSVAADNVHIKRVRASAARYIQRKQASQEHKVQEAKRLVGKMLEMFDDEKQKWIHTKVQDIQVNWLDAGMECLILHSVVPVDDLERILGAPRWVNLSAVRSYEAKRVEPDPETRLIWEANEAAEAVAKTKAFLCKLQLQARRKARQEREIAESKKFEEIRQHAIERKRRSAELEASTMLSTDTVKLVTKKIALRVLEELRAGLLKPSDIGIGKLTEDATASASKESDSDDYTDSSLDGEENGRNKTGHKTKRLQAISGDGRACDPEQSEEPEVWKVWLGIAAPRVNAARDLKRVPLIPLAPATIARKWRKRKLRQAAYLEAQKRWIADYVHSTVNAEERQWELAAEQRKIDVAATKKAEELAIEKAAKDEADREKALDIERAKQRKARRLALHEKIGLIPNFNVARSIAKNCEHIKSKSWGDRYGKGVRCLMCGKELTQTHLESSQQHGIGAGDDLALCTRVRRHRFNRAAYRAETDDMHNEINEIETERLRLEKERWLLREAEPHFYDFDDMKRVYDIDRRHQRRLKKHGIVRQGVQWSEEELAAHAQSMVVGDFDQDSQGQRRRDLTPRSRKKAEEEAAAFCKEATIYTPRLEDAQRKTAFRELILFAGRVNNFRQRLSELKAQHKDIHAERALLDAVLASLHREIFQSEVGLQRIADDLSETAVVLKMRTVAKQLFDNANEITKHARTKKRECELQCLGLTENADEAEKIAHLLGVAVRDLLRHRYRQNRQATAMFDRMNECRKKANTVAMDLCRSQAFIDSMHYRQRGVVVPTQYGHCYVRYYRASDRMVVVELPFGEPPARAYIPLESIVQTEKAIAASNSVAMRGEDSAGKRFYALERSQCKREIRLMHEDERRLKLKLDFDASVAEDKRLVAVKVRAAVDRGRHFISSKEGKREIFRRASKAVNKEARAREIALRTWRGIGKRPKIMNKYDREYFRIKKYRVLRKDFVLEQAKLAESEAQIAIQRRNATKAAEETLEFIYLGLLHAFISELANESIKAGIEATSRTEDETGVVFSGHMNMQYGVYSVLSKWWLDKKAVLRKQLTQWDAQSSQEALRRQNEKRKGEEVIRDVELRQAKEREKRRQSEVAKRIYTEERAAWTFYCEERSIFLAERRAMKAEETFMREYLKECQAIENHSAPVHTMKATEEEATFLHKSKIKALRRAQIKMNRVSRLHCQRELNAMQIEDELSALVRKEELWREQQEVLKNEMGASFSGDSSCIDDNNLSDDDLSASDSRKDILAEVYLTEEEKAKSRALKRADRIRRYRERLRMMAIAKNEAAEKIANDELNAERTEAMISHARLELDWMECEEEARLIEKEYRVAKENLRKINLYCQRKGREELRARATAISLRTQCTEQTEACSRATDWLAKCETKSDEQRQIQARVDKDTKFMDSRSITGVYQRYETPEMYRQLHHHYFRMLVYIIANRAEVIATERRQMLLHEMLQHNAIATTKRSTSLQALWKKRARDDLLRLRRSELGKRIFGKWQRKTITFVFRGWVRFWIWHRGHKDAFELKYAFLKQKREFLRVYPKILDNSPEIENENKEEEIIAVDEEAGDTTNIDLDVDLPPDPNLHPHQTLLEKLKQRTIVCVACGQHYTEAHNRADACNYHPGEYRLMCPRSCPGYGDSRRMTARCMGHRAKRWSCCDSRMKGSTGCRQRFHMPPSEEPLYGDVAKKFVQLFKAKTRELDDAIGEINKADFVHKAAKLHQERQEAMLLPLKNDRSIVARFKKSKLDKQFDENELKAVIKHQHLQRREDLSRHYPGFPLCPSQEPSFSSDALPDFIEQGEDTPATTNQNFVSSSSSLMRCA